MSTYFRYDNQRQAVLDLVKWFGFRRSLQIAWWFQSHRNSPDGEAPREVPEDVRFAIGMGGVQGYPVTAAWERWALGLKK